MEKFRKLEIKLYSAEQQRKIILLNYLSVLGKVGSNIYSALLMIICYEYFILDMVRIFKPNFLTENNDSTNNDSYNGFIDNDDSPK